MYENSEDYIRLVGEIFILLCLPLFLYGEIRDAIRNGWVWPEPWLRTGLFRITNMCFFILTLTAFIMRLAITKDEEIVLSLALLIGALLQSSSEFFPAVEFFLNYQQHKVGISVNYFFTFISFVKFIVVIHKFDGNAT